MKHFEYNWNLKTIEPLFDCKKDSVVRKSKGIFIPSESNATWKIGTELIWKRIHFRLMWMQLKGAIMLSESKFFFWFFLQQSGYNSEFLSSRANPTQKAMSFSFQFRLL